LLAVAHLNTAAPAVHAHVNDNAIDVADIDTRRTHTADMAGIPIDQSV
jgi:hypothetical protein